MEFKKLELAGGDKGQVSAMRNKHIRKTIIYALLGASAGFLLLLFSEGNRFSTLETVDILKNMAIGAFFGIFITNSPCARNKC
jgi:hypothetical protein